MNKILKYSLLALLGLFLIAGFTLGALNPNIHAINAVACPCIPSDEPYESPCNQRTGSNDFLFFTAIFNVGEFCKGHAVIDCPVSDEVNYAIPYSRLDLNCRYGISFVSYEIPLTPSYEKIKCVSDNC